MGRSHGGSSAHLHGHLRVRKWPALCRHTPLNLTTPQRTRWKHTRILSCLASVEPRIHRLAIQQEPGIAKVHAALNISVSWAPPSRFAPRASATEIILHPAASATEIRFPGRRTSTRSQMACPRVASFGFCLGGHSSLPFGIVSVHCPWKTTALKKKKPLREQKTDTQARAAADLPFGTSDNGTCDCDRFVFRLLRVVHP
jgi:hypothetical protein